MARLEEAHDSGGRRYYLEGRPIECGTRLEVSLNGGWLPVRFEMDLQQFPVFYLRLSEGRGLDSQVEFRLPDTAELRWPLQQDAPEDTQMRKLRRVVEDLAEIVHAPEDYTEDERDLAVLRARAVLRATAPRLLEEPGHVF